MGERRISESAYVYVKEVLDGDFHSSQNSRMTARFEKKCCEIWDMPYAIAHINGTATLHATIEALDIHQGDEVIVPPLTMSATAFAVLQANATPVFADVDPDTFQIDPVSIRTQISERTKAIITVALYGAPPEYDAILALCKQYGLFLIEDNAECYLARYHGQLVGTFGDVSSYSLQSSKHITAGEGGFVLVKDQALADRIRSVNSLGYAGVGARDGRITKDDIQHPSYDRHARMGWNYRMPDVCAAIGLSQLEDVERLVQKRVLCASHYSDAVGDSSLLKPQGLPANATHSYWTWVAALDTTRVSFEEFRACYMQNGGDGFYAAWKLSYMEPMFQNRALLGREAYLSEQNKAKWRLGLCPVAEELQPKLIQLKTNYMDETQMCQQAQALRKTLAHFA